MATFGTRLRRNKTEKLYVDNIRQRSSTVGITISAAYLILANLPNSDSIVSATGFVYQTTNGVLAVVT